MKSRGVDSGDEIEIYFDNNKAKMSFLIERENSEYVARWFKSKLFENQVYDGYLPSELNFACMGDLIIAINNKGHDRQYKFEDIIIAHGSIEQAFFFIRFNYWTLGGVNCEKNDEVKGNLQCDGIDQLSSIRVKMEIKRYVNCINSGMACLLHIRKPHFEIDFIELD